MPNTEKGKKILEKMQEEYGPEKGKRVFYASVNSGKIKGADTRTQSERSREAGRTRRRSSSTGRTSRSRSSSR